MQPKNCLFLCAWLALTASAQISNVGRPFTTSTQAVISYQAPDPAACTIEVREKGSSTLVHDVNPILFPGSNSDLTRASSVVVGQRRIVVVGLRVAEAASDTFRYSRALQVDTEHDHTITCGASSYSGTFRTTNIPAGLAYMEPVPADPAKPGQTAWPELRFADRDQKIIDPQTGVLIRRISKATDVLLENNRNLQGAYGTNWTGASSLLVDDSAAATYSASTRDWIFLDIGNIEFYGGTRSAYAPPYNQIRLLLNAWCEGGDCTTASAPDRSIEVCLTLDGLSCHSDVLTQVLSTCNTSCTAATPHRYGIGDNLSLSEGPFQTWYASKKPGFDHTSINKRFGGVNRDGVNVTWAYGNYFDSVWRPGSRIKINGTLYTIAEIADEKHLTLETAPVGTENSTPFEASNFGMLIRKATTSLTPVVLQHANLSAVIHNGPGYWDAAGGIETYTNCSHQLVPGPGGELGWHCHISGILVWIGQDTGTVSYLGVPTVNPRAGVDGWPEIYCVPFWDKNQGNDILCATGDSTGDSLLIRARYFGDNSSIDTGPQGFYSKLRECGTFPQPCWEFTNLTPKSQNRSLRQLVTQFHPDFANFPNTGFKLQGPIGSSSRLLFIAARDYASNDNMSFMAMFNTITGNIDAAGPSWKYWPVRWSAVHGAQDIGDPDWALWALTYFRGPFTGTDNYAGYGPYYSKVASGAITTTGEACPIRPPGSPIAAGEWPTGNNCLTIAVDGEPGDPTPKFTNSGTVTVSGDVVTVTGGDFPVGLPAGSKMKVSTAYYVFTRTSASTGTLSPQPTAAIVNSAYQLFHEEVDNPKTGTARRDFAYLQDAEVQDVFCAENEPSYGGTNGCSYFFRTEYFRLLIKNGNSWILERGFSKRGYRQEFFAVNANAYIIAVPPSCDMKTYPCGGSSAYWNFSVDPLSMNQNNGLLLDTGSNGGGHGILRPIGEVTAVALSNCPVVDGLGYSCYNSRVGTSMDQTLRSTNNLVLSGQPAFHGKVGHSVPNVVDSHPSMAGLTHPMFQNPGTVPRWFVDGRPFLGGTGVSGSSGSPAAPVTGTLYKFTSAQVPRLRRKILPTMAYCGSNPLLDVSGPNSLIDGNPTDAYRYCVAEQNGECRGDSQSGDVYFNCPFLSTKHCNTGTIGAQESEVQDVCIGDNGSMTMSLMQGGFEKPNMSGLHLRPLTKGLNQYHFVDVFWNVKTTPDGKWMMFRALWADDYAHQTLIAKLPPFPAHDGINRADFIPVEVKVPAAADPSETHAVVEFGYGTDLHCTSRAEKCIKGAGVAEYSFEYENPTGVACASGCTIVVPGLPQHVLYYRVVRQKAGGVRSTEGQMQVAAMP